MSDLTSISPTSAGFWDGGNMSIHRTNALTTDHANERANQIQAVRVLHAHGALDLLPMLFGALGPTRAERERG